MTSAATDCLTMERNSATYNDIILRPRVLCDVRVADVSTTMLGHRISTPIFIAPTSMGKLFHPEGERELGRGAQSTGIPQCVSTSCSFPLPEVMDAVEETKSADGTNVPVFFQLYVDKDRRKSENLLRLVRERGVKAIFLTIDAPVIGKREADERLKADETMKLPMSGMKAKNDTKGGSLGRIMGQFIDASLTWDDIAWLRKAAPGLPIVLKGIQTAMDAVKALEAGVEAIYITNHGGRSLDTAPATILVLLELQKCCPRIFDKMEVYIDGGITRGTDIFKALCLGARAVGIGRGFLFALNYGKEGIEHFVNILTDELETTMQQCGITSLNQVHPGLLHTGAVDHLVPGSEEHPVSLAAPRPPQINLLNAYFIRIFTDLKSRGKGVTFHSPVITSPRDLHHPEGNSDIDSTRAEAGTDEELKDLDFEGAEANVEGEEKMSSADESSDAAPEWTQNEDRIIFMRKSEGKSWAEIGKELERSRRECQQHYRMLRSHAKELGITTDQLAKLYIEDEEEKTKPEKGSKDKSKNKSKDSDEDKSDKVKKDTTKSDSKSESKQKNKKNKNKKEASETSASNRDPERESDSGSSSSGEEGEEGEEDPTAEYWAQRRYLYDTVYGRMYPDQKIIRPDRFYSESDCRVLAGVEAHYRTNKWLYIQADFCNATGRMIEAEILKAKFYEDVD
ncbi:hypothetical protein O1611_g5827 [Lasiodiplodia mahajangana]|uniref:Uncharacterized protein n=1 Tax=Lasiodiplodia mahajangana TaxID=1108764 RepID=A0ACC2JKE7_9PEZI|nr:hypothetical protein O1611_g5827 [Lasiodiplodia mahajangana]